MKHRKLFTALLLLAFAVVSVGFIRNQDATVDKIAAQLEKWSTNYPVEKVYLQLDKPYYAVGDDIWFKAYVTIGGKHELSGLSGVLNVELIDDRDSVKQHIKLPVNSGLSWGDFALRDTLTEGNYRIRAYTNYMRNAGEDYFFDQHITIVNAISNKVFTKTAFTYTTQNGKQQVSALINYADMDGVPYANKEVKYAVQLNAKTIAKGKGITDDKGNLNVKFTNTLPVPLHTGDITTSFEIGDKVLVTKVIPVKATSANVDVQFFPEGGNLVNGIPSKVAFKAVGADGLGADIKGTVIDDKNNNVATFSSQHLGMGSFTMEPVAGTSYKAHITYADGSDKTIDLPKASDKGYVLAINMDDPYRVKIQVSTAKQTIADNPGDTVSLVAQSGGEIYYAGKSKPGVADFTANVLRKRFPSGIVQFTLFSSKGEPLNERLVFIQNSDQLKLNVTSANQTYAPKQKIKISLNAQNGDSKPVIGSFSAAVTDETKVPVDENDESTIMSNLLLTSDLRGYIEKPAYYFNANNEKAQEDIDVLMLTQGYHRFEWKELLNDNFPPLVYQPEKTLEISGHITTLGGKPIPFGKVTLLSTGGGIFFLDTVTDAQGKFVFDKLAFNDSIRFVIQARTGKDRKNVTINLDNVLQQGVTQNKTAPDIKVSVSDNLSAYLKSSKDLYNEELKYGLAKRIIVLKEVVIKSTRQVIKHSSNLNGPGNADQVLTSDQLGVGCPTLDMCLQGRLLGVIFRNGVPYSIRGNARMTINIDGITIPDDELSSINVDDVASVEVLRSIQYINVYGSQAGPGGIILITTKNGTDGDKSYLKRPAPGILTYSPIGLYKARLFYSTQYDDPKTNGAAELRSTIYWNPNIITDKNGTASFEYFNAGSKGTYRIVIEGIDADGNIGRQVYRYKVE